MRLARENFFEMIYCLKCDWDVKSLLTNCTWFCVILLAQHSGVNKLCELSDVYDLYCVTFVVSLSHWRIKIIITRLTGCSEPADTAAETYAASSSAAVGKSEESAATEAVAGGNNDDDDVYVDVDVLAESDSELWWDWDYCNAVFTWCVFHWLPLCWTRLGMIETDCTQISFLSLNDAVPTKIRMLTQYVS